MHAPRAFVAGLQASLCLTVLGGHAVAADTTSDAPPWGSLTTGSAIVRAGTRSDLTWQIEIPSNIRSVVNIDADGTITTLQDLTMRLRVLGASFQLDTRTYLPVEVYWNMGLSSWTRVFYGYQTDVDPTKVLVEQQVAANSKLEFRGRGYRSGWLPFYGTTAATYNLVALTNGDPVPSTTPAFQQGRIEEFLKPYLGDNGLIRIGPRDVIFLLELGQTSPTVSGFDLQDLVFLVTFE